MYTGATLTPLATAEYPGHQYIRRPQWPLQSSMRLHAQLCAAGAHGAPCDRQCAAAGLSLTLRALKVCPSYCACCPRVRSLLTSTKCWRDPAFALCAWCPLLLILHAQHKCSVTDIIARVRNLFIMGK